jgi:replication factor A1
MAQLTPGLCTRLQNTSCDNQDLFNTPHIVQFLSIKEVLANKGSPTNNPSDDRYRITISDGVNYMPALLAKQLNHLVHENKIEKHTVAILEKLMCTYVKENRYALAIFLPRFESEGS